MKRTTGIIALALALAACLFAFGCANDGTADSAITVSASATAHVQADKATIGMTLVAEKPTAAEASAAVLASADSISSSLYAHGVAEGGIQVGDPAIEELYVDGGTTVQEVPTGYFDWDGFWVDTGVQQITESVGAVLSGYKATVHVHASGIDASSLSQIISEAVAAGATGFDGLIFTVGDREAAYRQALAAAVDAAHEKAESLADASGVYVGRVVNMSENSTAESSYEIGGDASAIEPGNEATYDAAAGAVPVEANVTVSYAIQ